MSTSDMITSTEAKADSQNRDGSSGRGKPPVVVAGPTGERSMFRQYKPDQGKMTRTGTFVGLGVLVAWGAYFLYEKLSVFEGSEGWRNLVTLGIPIAFAVVVGGLAWFFIYGHRGTGDFMIATEGEMKKVSWSSKEEVIGSTKVVIMFTFMLALFLFVVDVVFQQVFKWIGVLKG